MPIDLNKKQTIEEITGGRIKKQPRGQAAPTGEKTRSMVRPQTQRKTDRSGG
jgi:hypothetical protein